MDIDMSNNNNKRRKYDDEANGNNNKSSDRSDVEALCDSDADCGDELSASSSGDDGSGSYSTSTTFVAWLEDSSEARGGGCATTAAASRIISVGELHFSNAEQLMEDCEDDDDDACSNAYCIVCQLRLVPPNDQDEGEDEEDEEMPSVYTFHDSFPFRVIQSSSCIVGIPLVPIEAAADNDVKKTIIGRTGEDGRGSEEEPTRFDYSMDGELRSSLLEELQSSQESKNDNNDVSPSWKASIPNDQVVIDGVNAWWEAGERTTGWDLSKIPREDYATLQTIHDVEEKKKMTKKKGRRDDDDEDNNILLSLYKDLCAFRPLHASKESDAQTLVRDTIEDRFEWRTSLCTYFAWAVPNDAALDAISNLKRPILEIGAGTGYWAWLLTRRNVNVAAYDLADSHAGEKHRFRHSIVRDGGVEQISRADHAGRTLMLSWPDIVGDEASTDADRGSFGMDALRAYEGGTCVYVGELGPNVVRAKEGWGDPFPPGGSSASAAFQEELHSRFVLEKRVVLPNWPPYNSHLTIWRRRK
eukprot:CAMPEP_0181121908 /NCGR_PEP_ID=MMETSP1071-20121207/25007_1 /TAXON_ID=35127 /ORGANISM="Thalassiosira sp., Strain NH16" /LENGTH=527 /DNA_ID=CAMNT_0023206795 /DNA_START=147 /DNA_END=1730 /DNA_ORIENTATION=-